MLHLMQPSVNMINVQPSGASHDCWCYATFGWSSFMLSSHDCWCYATFGWSWFMLSSHHHWCMTSSLLVSSHHCWYVCSPESCITSSLVLWYHHSCYDIIIVGYASFITSFVLSFITWLLVHPKVDHAPNSPNHHAAAQNRQKICSI